MKGNPREYSCVTPSSLLEALAWLSESGGTLRPLAGGTDLMVLMNTGRLAPRQFMNLWGLSELFGIEETSYGLRIGALTTFAHIRTDVAVRDKLPMLAQAAGQVGSVAIQNRATLGGNIANASPAADSLPALLAYGAEVECVSVRGTRIVDLSAFYTGYKKTVLRADELLRAVRIPIASGAGRSVESYHKVGPRRAQAISKVCFAGYAEVLSAGVGTVRVALAGVGPTVPRCRRVESLIVAEAPVPEIIEALRHEIAPIDDIRSTAVYRMRVAENLLADFVRRTERARVRG